MSLRNTAGQRRDNTRYPISRNDAVNKQFSMGPDPTAFAYAASVTLDVSPDTGSPMFAMSDLMTGDMALTLSGGEDGCSGVIAITQDSGGGNKITGVTAAGRDVLMRDDLASINTVAFKDGDAVSFLTYQYAPGVVFLSIVTGVAAAYG